MMNAHEDTDDDAPQLVNRDNFMHRQLQFIDALILKLDSSFTNDGSFKVRSGIKLLANQQKYRHDTRQAGGYSRQLCRDDGYNGR